MTVLFIILGILFIAGGFSCIFPLGAPLLAFIKVGYLSVILMVVFGIIGIIKSIIEKRFGVVFVFDILSIILGIVMLSFPGYFILAETVMLMMTAVWLVLMGIITIVNAIKITKATGSKIWILQLIFGIITILIGACSFFSPIYMALTIGVMIGIFFIDTGFTLIFGSIAARD